MKSVLKSLRTRLLGNTATKQDLDHLYNQIAGLQQIQNAMEGKVVLRPMRGWAISPDALAWVLAAVHVRQTPTVVEFGSGQSTVALAAALSHRGGRLISVEHDPEYLIGIQKQIETCGLGEVIEFTTASLIEHPNGIKSYDVTKIPKIVADVVLIDGPPITICGADTRLVPLRWAVANLAPGGSIFLDDSARPSEQTCIKLLEQEFRNLNVIPRSAEKGLVEIRSHQTTI